MDHEAFEILIEKRLHAAISAEESAALDAHLGACGDCRRTLEEAKTMDIALKQDEARTLAGFSAAEWTRLEEAVRRQSMASDGTQRGATFACYAALAIALLSLIEGLVRGTWSPLWIGNLLMVGVFVDMARSKSRAARIVDRLARGERMALVLEMRRRAWVGLLLGGLVTLLLAGYAMAMGTGMFGGRWDVRFGSAILAGILAYVFLIPTVMAIREIRDLARKARQ